LNVVALWAGNDPDYALRVEADKVPGVIIVDLPDGFNSLWLAARLFLKAVFDSSQ
jgi:hypothetical protein